MEQDVLMLAYANIVCDHMSDKSKAESLSACCTADCIFDVAAFFSFYQLLSLLLSCDVHSSALYNTPMLAPT